MKKKLVIILATLMVLMAAGVFHLIKNRDRLHSQARKEWKNSAIAEISRKGADTNWLSTELEVLREKTSKAGSDSGVWFSEHLIRMMNGDSIIYANKCSKENWKIHDIFIGLGSDGKWYFSTFHFCKQMIVLRMEEPSVNLSSFVTNYYLREFDGRSDACLESTWPPKSARAETAGSTP